MQRRFVYAGQGFLTALTAAYYKGKVTEHYYGTEASEKNRCYVYTIGVGLSDLSTNDGNKQLAQITMNPKEYFKAGIDGNTFYDGNGDNDFASYWSKYMAAIPANFNVQVNKNTNNNKMGILILIFLFIRISPNFDIL